MAKKFNILAVDDEEDIRLMVAAALKNNGYNCDTASDGPDCLKKVAEKKYDLIICDMIMPNPNDGFEVVAKLRANSETAMIPVIMLTGVDSRDKIREALDSGIDYYIVKPFDIGDLLSKVEWILQSPELPTDDTPGL